MSLIRTRPLSAVVSRTSSRARVLLPQPDSPTTARVVPGSTARLILRKTWRAP
jgi:hypothetical protein